ncbi:pimeloyl-ACP methyl ester esterase BioH [Candidatus Accumulibacter sp. ACC003]|uniref:pimeloyl-ACP methyl ester esterase BioH n=1 Tax=Candidatus Accumulibacter sp. ACC003 TaxID=2823334 RepID=UPI0025BFC864|nr:pimeloyl-ACP methyl ester esterase BioH [Candidatus Accumulibacter sp. ACC003]
MSTLHANRPHLALIHGWGLGSLAWQPLLERLSEGYRLHLVDLPGYGQAAASDDDFTATAQALVDALPAGVMLCGWSLGALLAMRAALLAPERVGGLLLVGATPCFMQRADWPSAQAPAVLDSFAASVRSKPEQTLQRFAALLSVGDETARASSRALLAGLRNSQTPDAATLCRGLDWLREVDLRSQASAISCPTVLIHGENDSLNPLAAAQYLSKELPNARLEVFAGAGHAPFLADPERFVGVLDNFCHAPATR